MNTNAVKLGKSEVNLIKQYCSRLSDQDISVLSQLLPQTIAFDRSEACSILQRDKEVDKWLMQASGSDDWFAKVDSIADFIVAEMESRLKKKK